MGSIKFGMGLPVIEDENYPNGTRIWLVPSSDYDVSTNIMIAWNPAEYLFENNLITYKNIE